MKFIVTAADETGTRTEGPFEFIADTAEEACELYREWAWAQAGDNPPATVLTADRVGWVQAGPLPIVHATPSDKEPS